ncbi:MAG: nicotinate (nicotinamide) nucleotide adenylyltransferase [Polyangiales bacterium]|nr:nicotinate (nicotinamide) nucleotide adenylyltransferase [Sandaracinus sp.]
MSVLAVFGGSFDPPHVAHVLVAAWAHATAGADRVLVVPAGAHPFGKKSASFEDRVAMCERAFAGLDFVEVDPIEASLTREGEKLYTLHVLEALAARHPDAQLRLVVGADVLAQTARWHRWDAIEKLAPPLVVGRGGYPLPPESPYAMPEVSSTDVRARLAAGEPTDALLPPSVRAYALERGLYTEATPRLRVAVVGRGRVARGLAAGATRAALTLVDARTPTSLDADLVVLAVADGAIEEVAAAFDGLVPKHVPFVHCAGARGPEALGDLQRPRGAAHPLVSFATLERSPALAGTTFVLAGDEAACAAATRLAEACDARAVQAPIHGGAYHAAAALAANGAAGLATVGVGLLESLGMTRVDAERALGALLRTVAENVEAVGVPTALTGPIRRGDGDTVRAHRAALASRPDELAAYDAVAPVILRTAIALGLDAERVAAVRAALDAEV